MFLRMEKFLMWRALRKSMISAEDEITNLSGLVPMYGRPVSESKSWNQIGRQDEIGDNCC